MKNAGRDEEIPRYIIVSDFARFELHDLEENKTYPFDLVDLHKNIQAFAFIPGYKQARLEAEDPINIRAVELLGGLHDALDEGGVILAMTSNGFLSASYSACLPTTPGFSSGTLSIYT